MHFIPYALTATRGQYGALENKESRLVRCRVVVACNQSERANLRLRRTTVSKGERDGTRMLAFLFDIVPINVSAAHPHTQSLAIHTDVHFIHSAAGLLGEGCFRDCKRRAGRITEGIRG